MKDIKFSIVVTAYNIEDYIDKCIDSILAQTYKNYELIIINDGSTDNTRSIIEKYKSENVKIINKENGGISSARNESIKYINGDYIWFIDGDDYIERNALELLSQKALEKDFDIITFPHYCDYIEYKTKFVDRFDIANEDELPLVVHSPWSKIYKTSFYIENGFKFLHGKIYEDMALMPYTMVKAKSIGRIDEYIYNYVQRSGSIMRFGKNFRTNRDDKFDALDELINSFKEDGLYDKYIEQLEYIVIRNLILVYTTEVLPFTKDIYKDRCDRALKYVNKINKKWYRNKYLNESSIATKIYVYLFRKKCFYLCKLALKIKKV